MREPRITTERLILRPFQADDLADYAALIRDKMASEYAPYDYQWPTDEDAMGDVIKFVMGEEMWLAVELKATGRVIGFIHTGRSEGEAERGLGYTILSAYQNKGYAYEGCVAQMDYCQKAFGTKRFVCGTADCNGPSVRLLQKLGFTKIESIEGCFARDAADNPIVFPAGKYEKVIAD